MNNLENSGLNNTKDLETILNNDLSFGLPKEDPVIKTLSQFFKEEITRATFQYSPFDASSKNTKYEIKSRRNTYSRYPTTIVPVSKTKNLSVNDRLVFVFNFTDGLYYIEYNSNTFSRYNIKQVEAVRKRNGVVGKTIEPHFEIPIEDLFLINI